MGAQGRTVEERIAALAGAQHGVVTRRQLLQAGISRAQIERRLRSGALLPAHRGVYRVGHRAASIQASFMAAVLACGDGAVLSGRAAAHLLRLLKGAPPTPQVTAPTERRIVGIHTRRSRSGIDPRETTVFRGIPTTNAARTLVDLAATLPLEGLARPCHEAGVLYGTTPAQLDAVLARTPNSPGAGRLRRVMSGEAPAVLSRLERRFLDLLRGEGILLPKTNRPAGGRRVDCRWPELGLTVELDGYRYHNSRHSWEQDRRREREARARGDEFLRFSYGDVFERPRTTLWDLRRLLTRRGPG